MNRMNVAVQDKTAGLLPPGQGVLQRKCGNKTIGTEECGACAGKKNSLQRKLAIGASNDPLEKEADRVADQVMRMPGGANIGGIAPRIQRYSGKTGGQVGTAPASVDRVLAGSGRPMEPVLRQDMEQRFGRDFSQVRVHSGSAAEQSAQDVSALAYTAGNNVVFGSGQFAPGTNVGKRLLAHELTHVVQQSGEERIRVGQSNENYGLSSTSSTNSSSLQRFGDPSKVPTGLVCPIATGSPGFVDTNLLFSLGSTNLSTRAIADISAFIVRWNAAGTNKPIRIDGYASTDGSDFLNWSLSCDRALKVAAELIAPSSGTQGISVSFIEIFVQGETSEFSTSLIQNRRSTIAADITLPPPPSCTHPGVSRTLELQPVFLRTGRADANPTGNSWTRRFNEANAIWGKLGVTFRELTPITFDTPLKTSGSAGLIAALRTGSGVEVFIVDNDLGSGAITFGPLAALCNTGKVVMSDLGTSDTLLAHELGHILGIQHPGTPPNPGDPGTIMVGSGSHSVANSRRNTMVNSAAILCPAGTGSTCLNPDV